MKYNSIQIIPAQPHDYFLAYNWLFYSGYPYVGVNPEAIPSPRDFQKDYPPSYFDGSAPDIGRSFIIVANEDKKVGHISYTSFHLLEGIAEVDIWMAGLEYTGKGIGGIALREFCPLMHAEHFTTLIIRPHKQNSRAIAAYEKAGFRQEVFIAEKFYKPEFIDLYVDGDFDPGEDTFMVNYLI